MYLLIVTGLSGAGKSQAMRRLEDTGFFCVDNLPSEMLQSFIRLCMKATPQVERAAVVVDSRSAMFKTNMENAFCVLDELGVEHGMLFLDCRDDILERRYNETRRRHPLDNDVKRGIAMERSLLAQFHETADYIIDTSELKPLELSHRIEELIAVNPGTGFILTIESFGYKRGVPLEADVVFDMRFSDNPFYEPELRQLSGMDGPVRDFIMADKDFVYTLDTIQALIERLAPRFIEQGKHRLMVACGCTGGRHRSVCAAQQLYGRLKDSFDVRLVHRDAGVEAGDIKDRTGGMEDK